MNGMNKAIRSLLALAVALAIVISAAPVCASANTGTVASQSELSAALSAGGEYRLTADVTVTSPLSAAAKGTVTIDLNGHVITCDLADDVLFKVNGANMLVTDSVGSGYIHTASDAFFLTSGSLRVGSVSIYSSGEDAACVYVLGGRAELVGCTLSAKPYGVYQDTSGETGGAIGNTASDSSAVLTECEILSEYAGIIHCAGKLTITGGSCKGGRVGLYSLCGGPEYGQIEIKSGIFEDQSLPYSMGGIAVYEGLDGTMRPTSCLAEGTAFSEPALTYIGTDLYPTWSTAGYVSVDQYSPLVLPTKEYKRGSFSDVRESEWYGAEKQAVIADVYELGLMKGTDAGQFLPTSPLSVSEAIYMAAIFHSYLNGGNGDADFTRYGNWYDVYVVYAVSKGIISPGEFNDMSRAVNRAEMARIFASAVSGHLYRLNHVDGLPDVSDTTPYASSIRLLYEAGILTGINAAGTYNPGGSVSRVEAAAIITRLALPHRRVPHTVFTDSGAVEPPASAGISWSDYYVEDMIIPDKDELQKMCILAVSTLATNFTVRIPTSLFDSEDFDTALNYGFFNCTCSYYYSPANGYIRLEFVDFNYKMYSRVAALLRYPSLEPSLDVAAVAYRDKILSIVGKIVDGSMNDAQKCRAIHDYLIRNYDYSNPVPSQSSDPAYSFTNLLDRGNGVCQAYMELFDLMAIASGLDSHLVIGCGISEAHGWNMVVLNNVTNNGKVYNGEYHIDVTWDDSGRANDLAYIRTDYFLLDENAILRDHTIDAII